MKCAPCGGTGWIISGEPVRRAAGDGRVCVYPPPVAKCQACNPVIPEPKDVDPEVANNPNGRNLRKDTEKWLGRNPSIAMKLLGFARELATRGRPFGIGLVWERMRYDLFLECRKVGEFKFNNNFRSYVARWLVDQDPSLKPFIRFRVVHY